MGGDEMILTLDTFLGMLVKSKLQNKHGSRF